MWRKESFRKLGKHECGGLFVCSSNALTSCTEDAISNKKLQILSLLRCGLKLSVFYSLLSMVLKTIANIKMWY